MKIVLATLLSTCLVTGGAFAHSPVAMAAAAATAPARADVHSSSKVDHHIQDLHAKLQITAAEETQWAAVASAMRESAVQLDSAIQAREAASKNATAVEDLTAYGAVAQAHADGVKQLAAAFGPLYAVMPPDQQQIADEVFGRRGHLMKKAAAEGK